jgi:hypothetical protein
MTPARPTTLGSDRGTAEVFIVTSDRNDHSLIAKHQLRDPCRHDANANWLASFAFDDGDSGVTKGVFDRLRTPSFRRVVRRARKSVRRRYARLTKEIPAGLFRAKARRSNAQLSTVNQLQTSHSC